jgi:hypothetical protein
MGVNAMLINVYQRTDGSVSRARFPAYSQEAADHQAEIAAKFGRKLLYRLRVQEPEELEE